MAKKDLNDYIKKSHIRALEKFKAELQAFSEETGEYPVTLYEDAYTSFKLYDIKLENGILDYGYNEGRSCDRIVRRDEDTRKYYEDEGSEGIMEYIKFWRKCLRRAKRYWAMDSEKLDAIQDGEIEDDDEEDD